MTLPAAARPSRASATSCATIAASIMPIGDPHAVAEANSPTAACPAASLAVSTRNGEQLT